MKAHDVARDILDSVVIDAEGTECGRVDDVDLELGPDCAVQVSALLIGPGALAPRLPALIQRLVQALFGTGLVRLTWPEVARVNDVVQLRRRAEELGLNAANRKAGRWISKLPMS